MAPRSPAGGSPRKRALQLRLYVAGASAPSARAVNNLEKVLSGRRKSSYVLEVVDLLSDPVRAEQDNIIAAPVLLRLEPHPPVRIIGDLDEFERVRQLLGMSEAAAGAAGPAD